MVWLHSWVFAFFLVWSDIPVLVLFLHHNNNVGPGLHVWVLSSCFLSHFKAMHIRLNSTLAVGMSVSVNDCLSWVGVCVASRFWNWVCLKYKVNPRPSVLLVLWPARCYEDNGYQISKCSWFSRWITGFEHHGDMVLSAGVPQQEDPDGPTPG